MSFYLTYNSDNDWYLTWLVNDSKILEKKEIFYPYYFETMTNLE